MSTINEQPHLLEHLECGLINTLLNSSGMSFKVYIKNVNGQGVSLCLGSLSPLTH